MTLKPTAQQQSAIDAFGSGAKSINIFAGAGCGKSRTLEFMARSTKRKGLLMAFNRAVADEAGRKLGGTSTTALNTHRIAYRWAMNDAQGKSVIEKLQSSSRVTRPQIAKYFQTEKFSYTVRGERTALTTTKVTDVAMETLSAFMKDGAFEVHAGHVPYVRGLEGPDVAGKGPVHEALTELVLPLAERMWQDILNPRGSGMRVTHDAYLKLWAASKPRLPYDFILLDEAQDTNPAVFSVFEAQDAQKISVGDSAQQLFAWNGSLNIMDRFEAEKQIKLTQSWRFGMAIQDAANVFLDQLDAPIRLEGNPRVPSVIREDAAFDPHKSSAVLVRTNAGAIQELMDTIQAQQSVHLVGGNRQFKAMIQSAERLRQGTPVTHPDFIGFNTWNDLRTYAQEDPDGMDLRVIVNLVDAHGTKSLLTALDHCTDNEEDAQTVISTVHKVKGREWDQVRLSSDFEGGVKRDKKKETGPSRESLMLYYVAVTRAKELLDPGPLHEFVGKDSGVPASAPETPPMLADASESITVSEKPSEPVQEAPSTFDSDEWFITPPTDPEEMGPDAYDPDPTPAQPLSASVAGENVGVTQKHVDALIERCGSTQAAQAYLDSVLTAILSK